MELMKFVECYTWPENEQFYIIIRINMQLAPAQKKAQFVLQDHLNKDSFVDVKDVQGNWRLARILERDDKYLTIRLDAWEAKFQQQLHFNSVRIAPLRRHTQGYTGPSKRTARDFMFKMLAQNLAQQKQKLEQVLAEQRPTMTAYDITQLIRGQVFVQVDTLLTFPCRLTPAQLKSIVGFLEYATNFSVRFSEKCLKLCSEHFQEFINNKQTYLTNPYVAQLAALQEILYYMMLIFTIKGELRNQLYAMCSSLTVQQWEGTLLEHFKALFLRMQGLSVMKKVFMYKDSNGKGFPCSTRRSSFLIINYFGNKGPHSIQQMPMLQLKDYNEVYKLIPIFLEFFPKQDTEIAIIQYSVSLAIASSSFDAKLRGINELKAYIQKIKNRDARNIFKNMTEEKVLQILQQSNFLDALIDPRNFNSEIFKRSVSMIRLLCEKKSLSSSHITQFFKQVFLEFRLAQNRHQSEIILIFSVVAEIANFASSQLLDHIFSEILKLKMNQMTINLIKEFTIKAIDNLSKQSSFFGFIRRKKCSSRYEYYGANLLWKQIQDDGSLEVKLIPIALEALKTIFMSESFKNVRDTYMGQCLQNIQKKKSFGQSMKMLLNILQSYSSQPALLMGQSRGVVVQRLDKKYQILQTASVGLRKSQFPKISYQQSVEYFFQFLEDYNSNLKQGLRVDNLKNLWRVNDNQIELLNFLKKHRSNEDKDWKRKLNKRLPVELIKELFTEIFLMGEYMNNYYELSPQVYDTVDELFLAMNSELKNIEMNDKNTIRLINLPLPGIQFYEGILLVNKFSKVTTTVLNKAKKRYVEIHLRPKDYSNIPKKVKLWGNFLDRLLQLLPRNRQTFLPTLYEFLKELEGKMIRQNVVHTSMLDIDVRCESKDKVIRLPRNSSIFKLRKMIIKEYGIDPTVNFFLEVCSNRKEVNFFEEEDYSVNAIELAKVGPSIRVTDIRGKHPHLYALQQFKEQISYKQRMYTLLIDMLSQPDAKEELIWDILQLLPKNRNVFDKLDNMANEFDSSKWKQFFNQSNLKKLNYKLRMLSELICKPAWVAALQATGGFEQMINKVVSFSTKDFSSADNIKCICVVLETFYNCINSTGISEKQLAAHLNASTLPQRVIQYILYPTEPSLTLTNCVLRLLLKLVGTNPTLVDIFFSNKGLIDRILFEGCFIYEQMQNDAFIANFMQLLSMHASAQYKVAIVTCLINNFLQLETLNKQQKCEYYFELLLGCLERMAQEDFKVIGEKEKKALEEFPEKVFASGIKETSQKGFNGLIYGALKIKSFQVRRSIRVPTENSQTAKKDTALVVLLVNSFLFHQSQLQASYIQSKRNTRELYQLLELLFFKNPADIQPLVELLVPRLQKAEWRKSYTLDWMLEVERQERKVYCGLRNLRATCYINCLLQQLYMIQPFRQAMLKLDTTPYNPNLKENQMYQLQKMFAFLKYSHKGSYNPKEFCQAFKDYQGKPIDINIQSDVDEFFNAFMQKLENLLKVTKSPEIMNNVFRGALSNQLVCQGCPHSSERQQHFLSLGVNIKNKSSLDQALKGFIQGQILDGDNAYYCQTCNKKVRTLKRLCIKQLPNILIIVLKRFEFNYDTMKKIKVNDYCSFPLDLDMRKYTAGHLKQNPEYLSDDYYQFKLRGVVVHYGSSEAGHYYSYIKDTEVKDEKKQWFEFNDDIISSFNIADLAEETFGGSQTFGANEFQSVRSEKCRNAYLLFYQRDARYKSATQKTEKMVDIEKLEGSEVPIKQLALHDNSSFEFSNIVFDLSFIDFMRNTISLESSFEVYKLGFIYFHTVLLRVRDKDDFVVPFCTVLQTILRKNPQVAEWYVNQVTKPFIKEFLLEAPKLIRYIVVGLVKIAISLVPTVSDNIIYSLISFVNPAAEKKSMTPFAKLFYEISLKPRDKELLQKLFYPQRVVAILTSDSSNKFQDIPETNDSSDFGSAVNEKDKDRGYGSLCTISLIQSLTNFQQAITIEDLDLILSKITERTSRKNIAKMAVKKFKGVDWEATLACLNRISQKMITGDDRDLKNYLYWFKQFLEIQDDLTEKRTEIIVQKQLQVMEVCDSMYYPFDNLFNFMIKFATKFPHYKAEIKKKLQIPINPTNKWLRMIEIWTYKSGMATKLVYNQDWKAYKSKQVTSLPETSSYYDQKRQIRQKQFDTIIKQTVVKQQRKQQGKPVQILDSDQDLVDRNNLILTTEQLPSYNIRMVRTIAKVKPVGRAGLLYRINVDGNLRWYVGDRDEFEFHNSI